MTKARLSGWTGVVPAATLPSPGRTTSTPPNGILSAASAPATTTCARESSSMKASRSAGYSGSRGT